MDPSRLLQNKIRKSSNQKIESSPSRLHLQRKHQVVTFRQCIQQVGRDDKYQHNVIILMTVFWISASLFLSYPFYLFEEAHYFVISPNILCRQYDYTCINKVCQLYYPKQILEHVKFEYTLTYKFNLFCNYKTKRVFYKYAISSLAIIGLLSYGMIADQKGRKIAMKIAWRFYTIGVVIFCVTQTQLLMIFGYFIAAINCFPSLILQFILMFETTNSQMRLLSFLRILLSGFIGSLLSTLIAEYIITSFGHIRLVIFITVALPALILCFFLDYIQQSPKFLYKNNKLKAFNVINKIARKNNKQSILIDLTSSQWVKLQNYKVSFTQMFTMNQFKYKLTNLFLLLLINFFNSKSAKIGMEIYTDSTFRGILVNGTTALAFFTLILTKLHIKILHLMICNVVFNCMYFILIHINVSDQQGQFSLINYLIILSLVLIRYICQMTYGSLLIVCIENCPTIVRGQALGFILGSMSIAEVITRMLASYQKVVSVINLFGILTSIIIQYRRNIYSQKILKMPDTIKGYYYDQFDKFVRIYKK